MVAGRDLKRVALVINSMPGFSVRVMEGIAAYVRERGPWRYLVTLNSYQGLEGWLARTQPDGVIAHAVNQRLEQVLMGSGLPVVNTSSNPDASRITTVRCDDRAVGRAAADHFLDRGFRRFAYCGVPDRFAQRRRDGFIERLAELGFACEMSPGAITHEGGTHRLPGEAERWLKGLTGPVGLFTSHDLAALELTDGCARLGVTVPERVAIAGVDNDPTICESTVPALSSVDTNLVRQGYEAAAALARLMAGEPGPLPVLEVPPVGVVARRSTDTVATDDPAVIAAIRYIHEQIDQPIEVEDILDHVTISRRSLERRFRDVLGRSPREEIRRVRLEMARSLLSDTELSLGVIAAKCGFSYLSHLSAAFKKAYGVTPSDYRSDARVR